MRFNSNIGFLLLAIFLIVYGLTVIVPLGIPAVLLGALALISGIFILIGR